MTVAKLPVTDCSLCRYSGTRAIVVAFVLTLFSFFNIPVFWPILVLYFFILFSLTMKRQIMVSVVVAVYSPSSNSIGLLFFLQHMIRYRYLPFSYGKRTYKGKEETVS